MITKEALPALYTRLSGLDELQRVRCGKREYALQAASDAIVEIDRTARSLYDPSNDCQAKSRARNVRARAAAIKAIEGTIEVSFAHSGTSIHDA